MRNLVTILALIVLAAACGGGDAEPLSATAASGEELYRERVLGGNAGCITCHSLDADTTLVGPSLAGVATRAADRVPGVTAAEYLRTSILRPAAYVVDGYEPDRMPANWGEVLTEAEVDALVAFLEAQT